MKKIFVLAWFTFLELAREKMVLISLLVSAGLLLLSLLLGSLTFDEKLRVITHVGIATVHFCLIVMAMILGSNLLHKEIQRQTCLVVLARPINRLQFIIGKYLGILILLFFVWLVLSFCMQLLLWGQLPIVSLTLSLFATLLEAALLLAVAFLTASFLRPAISMLAVFSTYLLGHWLSDLHFFAKKSESLLFAYVAKVFHWTVPHLENFNWRSVGMIQSGISAEVFATALFHALAWILFLNFVSFLIFRRKDLV